MKKSGSSSDGTMSGSLRPKVAAMIPTYNEAENIRDLVTAILALPLDADLEVLVADDDSPDGTAAVVRDMAAADRRIHLLLRTKRRGRGSGGIDGFKASLALAPDLVVEMDGDFSHQPRFIPALVAAARDYDLVLGSRLVKGGRDADRGLIRRIVTILVSLFIRRLFRIRVKDVSSGFRCFRREVLEALDLDDLISVGPSVVLETLRKAQLLGFRIGEVPIEFIDRTRGKTKLSALTLIETLLMAVKFKRRYTPANVKRV
jgi:dolichol-phosphate mannosyltransferase